jgi:Coenzyme PQQ synthesis protein D (PqqD)
LKLAGFLDSSAGMTILTKVIGQFAETSLDDELVLMNLDTGSFYALKGTGLAIWTMIDGVQSNDAITSALAARYAVDPAQCEAELAAFAGQLTDAGFLIAA